jgi:DNA ligase D-like protein (predicted ligase)
MTNQPRGSSPGLPKPIKPQLCKLVDAPPQAPEWLHEIKYDGYRMHARLDRGKVSLLTHTGLDWTHKYPSIAAALTVLPATQAYLDGELSGVLSDGKTSFSMIQAASDSGNAAALVFFVFDLLYLDGEVIGAAPLRERKERLRHLLSNVGAPLQYSDHQIGRGPEFYARACELSLEGIISKRADAPYSPGDRGLWVKVKCQNREEFVVVGWTDPEGVASLARCAALGLLRSGRAARLCRTRRDWNWPGGALPAMASAATPRHFRDAAAGGATSVKPLRFTARPQPRALGSPRACGRGQIPDMDRRQPASSGRLRGSARGQRSDRRPASRAEPSIVCGRPVSLGDSNSVRRRWCRWAF